MSTVNPLDVLESVRAGRISQADGIALLSIDGRVTEDQLKQIASLPGVRQAKSLAF